MKNSHFIRSGIVLALAVLPLSAFALTTNLNGSVQVNTSSSQGANLQTNKDEDDNAHLDTDTLVKLEVNSKGAEIKSSGQVSSEDDLEVFKKNVSKKNKNVSSVESESNGDLEVKYKHKGRFLGLFPAYFNAITHVDASEKNDTKVWTRMAWWNIFVTGTHSIDDSVDSDLKNSTEVSAAAKANASASAKARAIEAIIAAHAKAESETKTSVK